MTNILEGTIDLNNLFNLNYNFDLLKNIIDAVLKGQKGLQQKVNELEEKDTMKEKRITQLELELSTMKPGGNRRRQSRSNTNEENDDQNDQNSGENNQTGNNSDRFNVSYIKIIHHDKAKTKLP